jgi:hypothetical protein
MSLCQDDIYFTAEVNETAYDWLSVRTMPKNIMLLDGVTEPTLRFETGDTCYLHPEQVKSLVMALREWLEKVEKK